MEINNSDHTILLVDDEENIIRSLKRLIREYDYNVITATSGAQGLELLEEHRVSLIISDQRMPNMNGSEFLAKAKVKSPDALRILLTGYSDINATMDAINQGEIYKYISKPWNDDEICAVIKEAIERYSLVEENKRLNRMLKEWNEKLEDRVEEQTVDIKKRNKALLLLNDRLKNNFTSIIEAFSGLLELRNSNVSSHSRNVAEISRRIAEAIALPEKEVSAIYAAGLLHDIGKIAIPDSILNKRESDLTLEDKKEIELHPIRGQAAVEPIEALRSSGLLIRHHHERCDGRGYPGGLKQDRIPMGSRIIAIADGVVNAAASDYEEKLPDYNTAIDIIQGQIGANFDQKIFPVAKKVVMEFAKSQDPGFRPRKKIDKIEDLYAGMVLAVDVVSGTGVLILAANTTLDLESIGSLKRFSAFDPFKQSIYVWE